MTLLCLLPLKNDMGLASCSGVKLKGRRDAAVNMPLLGPLWTATAVKPVL
jgi:hypothetical protein